ncbi:bifunctional enoyl-CoA hydratase/phosphate acetyltransferase [Aquibacillus sp. 3ASR75-11]|uniref:Bifunctional enoyl-CoA hydratase/phosphate acetyltransferase n=1 Tax=Terrihalobacillus insolitus TaxID=2950438 RepID=A0A9X3WXX5_9BACI|nr:bifunctional enoyl-CoA hydratase/phosphate acetyltransferase [Terrihalobacillus insolitus]MDC3414449.1 bifunctional enoyl-CoA hydratase/phosphate acetyltransferase [Terrihalobacillus insolitus]MDC3425329.1 bifunctional enoyl-CoA hydratase/phosphate acetyltransferase [Terrihalobacillus insolitus]
MEQLSELLREIDISKKKTIAVAQAANKGVLQAIQNALDFHLCSFILFGDQEKIKMIAANIHLNVDQNNITIVHVQDDRNVPYETMKVVASDEVDVLMKGDISTKELLTAVLDKNVGIRSDNILSQVALFEIPDREKLIFLTDAGMNIAPSLKEKAQIIHNAVQVANRVGIHLPKVAPIAAVEHVNPSMQATMDGASLTQMQRRNQITDCIVDGPLAFDNAVNKESAVEKRISSEVAGDADILLVPTIEVGNALYKSFVYFAHAKVASIIYGANIPIVLTSRSDSAENKLYSIALALLSSNH